MSLSNKLKQWIQSYKPTQARQQAKTDIYRPVNFQSLLRDYGESRKMKNQIARKPQNYLKKLKQPIKAEKGQTNQQKQRFEIDIESHKENQNMNSEHTENIDKFNSLEKSEISQQQNQQLEQNYESQNLSMLFDFPNHENQLSNIQKNLEQDIKNEAEPNQKNNRFSEEKNSIVNQVNQGGNKKNINKCYRLKTKLSLRLISKKLKKQSFEQIFEDLFAKRKLLLQKDDCIYQQSEHNEEKRDQQIKQALYEALSYLVRQNQI